MRLEIPMQILTPNQSEHHFRRAKRRRAQRGSVTACLRAYQGDMPALPIVVTLTRVASRALDDDNLAYAFKALRDAIAAWYGVGDAPGDPIVWRYAQAKTNRGYQAARIEIERGSR